MSDYGSSSFEYDIGALVANVSNPARFIAERIFG